MSDVPIIDARGMRCPWPALRVARAMRNVCAVMVLADDPIAPTELAALAEQQGWEIARIADDRAPAFRLERPTRS
ncbi:MAG: sulfurtransferase TusA family protein [Pseudomonadota bacterium]|uniref:sulfurtransferase TusA family protein n=1 Tax=Sphingobium sp. BS19 TaxID=3018973 RepID=UPI00249036F7|nr:sulfurtransferase TusA family protein [Sphingobium sp. BS19]